MSTRAQLRLATYRRINEDDPADATNTTPAAGVTHFTSTEIDDYIQQAVTLLGTEMEWAFQVSEATAIEDQALYELPSDFIAISHAYFDNHPITIIERGDLPDINKTWQDSPSSLPRFAYKADNNVVGLYPAPDSVNAGKILQIEYIAVPAALSTDADIPDLHSAFHMCLPFYAAYLCEDKMGNDKKAQIQFSAYETHRKKLMAKVQSWSPSLMRLRWAGEY